MTLIDDNPARYRPRGKDNHVMFVVRFEDGRSAYVRIDPKAAEFGTAPVLGIAKARQQTGEIPDGRAASEVILTRGARSLSA